MAFEIVELKKETFTGNKVEIPEFDPQKGFGPMSEIKESAHTKFAKNEKDYVGINASLDDLQYYIVASAKGENGDTTFDIPEGKYAKFVTSETDRPALDG
ncbi:effector binding domain-containing protein, partial [Listeria monocytogenes]